MTKLSLADMKRMLRDSQKRNTALQDEALRLRVRNARMEKAADALDRYLDGCVASGLYADVADVDRLHAAWQEAKGE